MSTDALPVPPPPPAPPPPPSLLEGKAPHISAIARSGPQKQAPRPRAAPRTATALPGTEESLTPQSSKSKRELPSSTHAPAAFSSGPLPRPPSHPLLPSTPKENWSHEVAVTGRAEGNESATDELHGRPWRSEAIGSKDDVDQAHPSPTAVPLPPPSSPATIRVTMNQRPASSFPAASRDLEHAPRAGHCNRTESRTRRASDPPAAPHQSEELPASFESGAMATLCSKGADASRRC